MYRGKFYNIIARHETWKDRWDEEGVDAQIEEEDKERAKIVDQLLKDNAEFFVKSSYDIGVPKDIEVAIETTGPP